MKGELIVWAQYTGRLFMWWIHRRDKIFDPAYRYMHQQFYGYLLDRLPPPGRGFGKLISKVSDQANWEISHYGNNGNDLILDTRKATTGWQYRVRRYMSNNDIENTIQSVLAFDWGFESEEEAYQAGDVVRNFLNNRIQDNES